MVFTEFGVQPLCLGPTQGWVHLSSWGVFCKRSQTEANRLVFLPHCAQALGVTTKSSLDSQATSGEDCQVFAVALQAAQENSLSTWRCSDAHTTVGGNVCASRQDTWSSTYQAIHRRSRNLNPATAAEAGLTGCHASVSLAPLENYPPWRRL